MLTMNVKVKLYATLRRFAPDGTAIGEAFRVNLQGSTLLDLIQSLGFSSEQAKIVMVNGQRVAEMDYNLVEDDLIVIFPPVGGG
jgi:molybdopterin converting factor small subunit